MDDSFEAKKGFWLNGSLGCIIKSCGSGLNRKHIEWSPLCTHQMNSYRLGWRKMTRLWAWHLQGLAPRRVVDWWSSLKCGGQEGGEVRLPFPSAFRGVSHTVMAWQQRCPDGLAWQGPERAPQGSSNTVTQDSILPETQEGESLGHFFLLPIWEPEPKGRKGREHTEALGIFKSSETMQWLKIQKQKIYEKCLGLWVWFLSSDNFYIYL